MSPFARFEQFRRRGVARTVLGLLTAAMLAVIAVAGASIWAAERSRAETAWVVHTYQVLQASSQVFSAVLDAETSQRGYLLSGDRSYLARYLPERDGLPRQIDHLEWLTRDNPRETVRIRALREAVRDRLATLDQNVRFTESGQRDNAIAGIRSGRGRAQMRRVRLLVDGIGEEERGLLDRRTRAAKAANDLTLAIDLASLALIVLFAALSIAVVRRYVVQLQASQRELDRLNRSLEDTVAARTEQLTRANEEIQRFAYIVSHDLRAPLVNVMGFTSELQAAGAAFARQLKAVQDEAPQLVDEEAQAAITQDVPEAIQFIRASTAKMDSLINAILRLSREGRRVLRAEPIDMTMAAGAIADSVRHQTAEAGASITVEPLPVLTSDRLSIEQVFGNLLDNALKYLDPLRPGRIVVRGRDEGGWLVYEVEDNGRGIAAKDHERVFELFRRAGAQTIAGEGLGLAFVRNSVRRLGGDISLRSELGEGSTFTLKFPKGIVSFVEEST